MRRSRGAEADWVHIVFEEFFQDIRWSYSVECLDLGNTKREMENWVTDLSVTSVMEVIINIRDVEAISPRKWEKWQRSPRKTIDQGRRRGPCKESGNSRKVWAKAGVGLPWWLSVKNPPANAGVMGSILGWGRSPREGNGNQLQYSCLGNPMDRGAWKTIVHGVAKELDTT